ncbi:MAG: PAS domain S-box protein [Deltaproteobacteria bacterium]|nr:PAS domain S-box protein [Deltaproteobacteria bacterium]
MENAPRILVVAAGQQTREKLESLLAGSEAQLIFIPQKPEAVEAEVGREASLLLLDYDGDIEAHLDFIRGVSKSKKTRGLPVFLLADDDDRIIKALEVGVSGFIFKPLRRSELLVRIGAILRSLDFPTPVSAQEVALGNILGLTQTLVSTLDFQEILYTIVKRVAEVVRVDRVSIVLVPDKPDVGYVVATSDNAEITHLRLDLNKYPEIQHVLNTGKSLVINNAETHPLLDVVRTSVTNRLSALTLIPIVWEEKALGVFFIRAATHQGALTPRQMFVCKALVNATAVALHNARVLQKLREESLSSANARIAVENRLESLKKYADIFASSGDGIAVFGPDGRTLLTNPGVEKILGYQEHEMIGQPIWEVIFNQDREELIELYKQVTRGVSLENRDVNVKRKDGETRIVECSFAALSDTGGAILVLFRDVTEARIIKDELVKTKNFLESLIDTSIDPIIAHDPKGTIILYNSAAERLYGWRAEEVLHNMSVKALYPGEGARKIGKMLRSDKYGGVGRLGPIRIDANNAKGEVFPISLTAAFIYENGVHTATFGIFTDLRETVRVEKQLARMQQQLAISEKQSLIAELAGATAHELNQPLTGVIGYAEYLLRMLESNSELSHAAEVIHREAERMAKIVRQIGKLTRYETRSYVGEQRILDLDRASRADSENPKEEEP